jgi:hypothetical protein
MIEQSPIVDAIGVFLVLVFCSPGLILSPAKLNISMLIRKNKYKLIIKLIE